MKESIAVTARKIQKTPLRTMQKQRPLA